jgi:hypothetical protein
MLDRRQPCLLDPHLAGGDRQPQDVVRRPRGTIGDRARESPDLGTQHREGRHEGLDVAERTGVVLLGPELDDVSGRQPSGAAQRHGDPHAGHDARHPLGDAVIEQPVELRQRRIDQHPGDGGRRHG